MFVGLGFPSAFKDANIDTVSMYEELSIETTEELTSIICAYLFCTALTKAELLKILLGIKQLARKQRTMISEWKDVNEGWEKDDNIQTKLTTLICHSMTDIENDEKETSKIIRAISKNVYLDNDAKQQYIK